MEINKKINYGFLTLIVLLYLFLGLAKVITMRPVGVHMWAMCDRASIARNYEQESMNFFKPRIHETQEKQGITGLEFPLMNYAAAIFYRIFGFHDAGYRILMLLVLTTGLFAAFKIGLIFTRSWLAGIAPLVMLSSPVLTYYAASFIPDTASLGFALMGWYLFFLLRDHYKWQTLLIFTICISVSTLIKITSMISVITMLVLLALDHFRFLGDQQKRFTKTFTLVCSLLFSILITIVWYKYADWLSHKENYGVFLMSMKKPESWMQAKECLKRINEIWVQFYFYKPMLWLIIISFFLQIILFKKMNRWLLFASLGIWAGNLCFFYLMMEQFINHDYYLITLFTALLFQILGLAECFSRMIKNKFAGKALISAMAVLLCLAFIKDKNHQEFRYQPTCWLYDWSRFADYLNVEPYVASIGIDRHEKVIAICDESPNIALYYLNLKGWHFSPHSSDDELKKILESHPSYVITNDSTQINRDPLKEHVGLFAGKKGSILFYHLKY